MIKKKYVKSRNVYKITFELPEDQLPEGVEVKNIHLVGDFNQWDPSATPLSLEKSGAFRLVLELEPEREYQFRYLINSVYWCNDRDADAFISNPFWDENGVVATNIEADTSR
jgi:hypothetical protein